MNVKDKILSNLFDVFIYATLIFCVIITIYPLLYTLSMSISDPIAVARNEIFLFPKGFSLKSYGMVFQNKEIWVSYYNTLWYTSVGTAINVAITILSGYALSRKRFFLRKKLMMMIVFTMFFSGGLIPQFILVNNLHLYNTRWAIIIPSAINTFNLIICIIFFQGIPDSIEEAASIDGASQYRILFKIFIPLSMPIIAVLALFYAVGHWNSYFAAMIYLPNADLQPLQLYLRKVLILSNTQSLSSSITGGYERSMATIQLKYSVIIVSMLPILCTYPFLQKYFIKGVMIGSIKG